jgi:hypothetical protein
MNSNSTIRQQQKSLKPSGTGSRAESHFINKASHRTPRVVYKEPQFSSLWWSSSMSSRRSNRIAQPFIQLRRSPNIHKTNSGNNNNIKWKTWTVNKGESARRSWHHLTTLPLMVAGGGRRRHLNHVGIIERWAARSDVPPARGTRTDQNRIRINGRAKRNEESV